MWKLVVLVSLVQFAFAYDRYHPKDVERGYSIEEPMHFRPVRSADPEKNVSTPFTPASYTFPNHTYCVERCELPCAVTHVYMSHNEPSQPTAMYTCNKLKPPKTNFFASVKQSSFYMTLIVLACIVIVMVVLLSLCYCCASCCRQASSSSRGSSKDALNPQEDGEFREYLQEDVVGAVKKERDFTRRPQRQTLTV